MQSARILRHVRIIPKITGMRLQRCLLVVAGIAGLLAIGAGLVGFNRLAGGAAAVLLVSFLLAPWVNREKP